MAVYGCAWTIAMPLTARNKAHVCNIRLNWPLRGAPIALAAVNACAVDTTDQSIL